MKNIKYDIMGKCENVGVITLNRPKELNALDTETLNEFKELLKEIEKDLKVRCVVLTGEGRAFCAGGDIREEVGKTVISGYEFFRNCAELHTHMGRFRTPIIGAINGYALGGGLELALACDIRIASKNALLGLPEVTLAIGPGFGGTQRLPRLIPVSKAKQMMLTGEPVSAPEAWRIGLVDEITEPGELMQYALRMADKISGWGPLAVKNIKAAVTEGLECDLERGIQIESNLMAQLYGTEDLVEAMNAFLEKRAPKAFAGK